MKFSLSYKSKYKQQADEIRCPINQLGLIFSFIKDNPNKRYNIILNNEKLMEKELEQINLIKTITSNYTIQGSNIATIIALIDQGYNAYLRFPVVDWESFCNQQDMNVSDIYIDGSLGFQCDNLKISKGNTLIRISPTISSNANLNQQVTNANSFFIRPEDLILYEDIIDIIDFKVDDQEKEDTLFQIYKRGTFNFDLSQLIEHLHTKVPNMFIQSEFAKQRLNCGQRCLMPGKSCHLCDTNFTLTNTLLSYFENMN